MLNKATLIGRLGNDPEVRYMPNGNPVANISLATTRRWKDKQTNERVESTDWHRVIFFNRLAEIVGEYVKKGSQIYIEGRLQTRSWEKDGQTHFTTEIIASEMHMLDSKKDDGYNAHNTPSSTTRTPRGNNNSSSAPPPQSVMPPVPDYADFDDDIPL